MSRILLSLTSILFSTAPALSQTTWYVDDNSCPGPGLGTQGQPFCSIQNGINAAINGDTVLVLPGTYTENLDLQSKSLILRSSDGATATTIQGSPSAFSPTITVGSSLLPGCVVEGFTITGGTASVLGSGLDAWGFAVVRDNLIENNFGDFGSGGVFLRDQSMAIDNVIRNNGSAFATGGVRCEGAAVLQGNWIESNGSGFSHGGVSCSEQSMVLNNTIVANTCGDGFAAGLSASGDAVVEGNRILNNTHTDGEAGGIYIGSGAPLVVGNEIMGNVGGVTCWGGTPHLLNNIIADNHTQSGGIDCVGGTVTVLGNTLVGNAPYGIECSEGGTMTVRNSILWDNGGGTGIQIRVATSFSPTTVDIAYSDTQGGLAGISVDPGATLTWGAGMIDADPLFLDRNGIDNDPAQVADNDFHLSVLSPCVDAGDNTVFGLPSEDLEGDSRRHDVPTVADTGNGSTPLVDVGADEFHRHLYLRGDFTVGGSIEVKVLGLPGSPYVGLWLGFDALEIPISTPLGDWYLLPPVVFLSLGGISGEGALVLPGTVPMPVELYFLAALGQPPVLTNLATLRVD
jgi:hypothetical protein